MLRHNHVGEKLQPQIDSHLVYRRYNRRSKAIIRKKRQTAMNTESYKSRPTIMVIVFQLHWSGKNLWRPNKSITIPTRRLGEDAVTLGGLPQSAL